MKLFEAIRRNGAERSVTQVQEISESLDLNWNSGIGFVFQALVRDEDRVPNIGTKKDNEVDVLRKWVSKYISGLNNRPSLRISKALGTVPDPIISVILEARLPKLSDDDLEKMTFAHRLQMSAENILGLLLEEYLHYRLHEHQWHCAWGETVKSVDFVHAEGGLLQIKNRSNSENSSSSAIRTGTEIQKWYRIKADKLEYKWEGLRAITGCRELSESDFKSYVTQILVTNPACLAIEKASPWIGYTDAESNNNG